MDGTVTIAAHDYVQLALAILGTACTTVFSIIGWIIRVELKRTLTRIDGLENDRKRMEKEAGEFREWVRFIFALTGIITADGLPTGSSIAPRRQR